MTNFLEGELRKLFGNGEVIENPVFLGNVCAGTLDGDLRVRAEFAATAEEDEYDALRIRVVNRGGGEVDRLTLRFMDVGQKAVPKKPAHCGGYGTLRDNVIERGVLARKSRRRGQALSLGAGRSVSERLPAKEWVSRDDELF